MKGGIMSNKENAVGLLFKYAGDEKIKLYKSIMLADIGELFGMIPLLAIAWLIKKNMTNWSVI